jgi:hypothetical protein
MHARRWQHPLSSKGSQALIFLHMRLQTAEDALARKARSNGGLKLLREEVTEADIAEIISKWTGGAQLRWHHAMLHA